MEELIKTRIIFRMPNALDTYSIAKFFFLQKKN